MVAAPFKSVLKFKCQDGHTFQHPCTVSDVNGEFYVYPSGLGDVILPSNHGNVALVDVVLSASGTDTSTADIFYNGSNTGIRIMNAACVSTVIGRQLAGSPVVFAPGGRLKIKQNT